jgi:hypothetical protein
MNLAAPSRPAWQWLILLAPAVQVLAGCLTLRSGSYVILILNLLASAVLCLGLGIWWMWRRPALGERVALGILAGAGIAVVNGLIALAGCSALLR